MSKSIETANHGVIDYHLYGDKGECNEYYIIVAKKSANIEELLSFLGESDVQLISEVEGTDFVLYYKRYNYNDDIVWKEPLYQRFNLSTLNSGVLIVESNNNCCVREDFNEIDKPWRYFGIYGRYVSNKLTHWAFDKDEWYCDIHWEVFVNGVYHLSSDTEFKCEEALNDIKKWFKEAGDISSENTEKIVLTICNMMLSERLDENGNIKTEYDALLQI